MGLVGRMNRIKEKFIINFGMLQCIGYLTRQSNLYKPMDRDNIAELRATSEKEASWIPWF